MAESEIPFREDMASVAFNHWKFCTSRNQKYGEVGDNFPLRSGARNGVFVILAHTRHSLDYVAWNLYLVEGFKSYKDFVDVWLELHPKAGWEPEKRVWVHWFERVE